MLTMFCKLKTEIKIVCCCRLYCNSCSSNSSRNINNNEIVFLFAIFILKRIAAKYLLYNVLKSGSNGSMLRWFYNDSKSWVRSEKKNLRMGQLNQDEITKLKILLVFNWRHIGHNIYHLKYCYVFTF